MGMSSWPTSRTLRSTPESGQRAGYDGAKRKRGSKVHMAVDTLGHLLALHVTAADVGDREAVARLAADIQDVTGDTVSLAYVDQATPDRWWQRRPRPKGSDSKWSNCLRLSAASFFCPDGGLWKGPLRGPRDTAGSSRTTNASDLHRRSDPEVVRRGTDICAELIR